MSSSDRSSELLQMLKRSLDEDRLAHAYVVVGPPRTVGFSFMDSMVRMLIPGFAYEDFRAHPDIFVVEPEGKKREIRINPIRELNRRIAQTSTDGGWKIGVVMHADRMNDNAANAFLKTLEEPPGKCLLLLITDDPQRLLPTIISRCQRLVLSEGDVGSVSDDERWREPVMEILRRGWGTSVISRMAVASQLQAIFDDLKKEIEQDEVERFGDVESKEDEKIRDARITGRLRGVQTDVMRHILLWHRDILMQTIGADAAVLNFPEELSELRARAEGLTYDAALHNLGVIEGVTRQITDRFIRPQAAFESGLMRQRVAAKSA